jgi:hypothetical protein
MTSVIRAALSRFRFSLVALQWGGNLFAMLLAAAWLQIPDSHAWQFAFSMISAVVLVIGFCWLQVFTFSRVRAHAETASLWLRIAGFALVATLWVLLAQWVTSGSDQISQYAYDWNSKLSPDMRITFSPTRIIAGLNIFLEVIVWAITALLLPIVIAVSTQGLARPSWKDATRPYRRMLYWVVVFLFCLVTTQLTAALVSWMPGKSVSGEVVSVLVRLAVAYTTDVLLWCLLLAFTAAWMESGPAPAPEIAQDS